jgi:hypothetical protein
MATWKKVLVEGAVAINDLSDVSVSSASSAQILVHDGVDSFDNVSVSGDVTIATSGEVTIGADKVVTAKILNANVTTAKLADDAVTVDKLADSAVVTANIVDSNVTLAKIANIAAATVLGNATASPAAPTALTIDADLTSVSANDDTLASAKAIKAYVDTQVASGYDLDISADSGTNQTITNAETLDLAGTSNQISTTAGTNSVTFSIPTTFTAPGSIASTSTITAATGLTVTTGGASITGNTTVTGDLTVTGTTTTLQTQNVLVEDKLIVLGNPDTAYASDAAAITGAEGGGIAVLSDTSGTEGDYAAVIWNNNYLTGWELGDASSVSEDGNKHPIAIMDFVVNSAAAPTADSAGVGSFFFAQANGTSDGDLYVRVQ